jgi:transcriptional regulator with XRE-family HTH domain
MLNTTVIKNAMLQNGLNQANLADKCGVTREAVSRWMAGESIPRPAKLKLLSEILGLAIVDMLPLREALAMPSIPADPSQLASQEDMEALCDLGHRLRELEYFVPLAPVFEPRALASPSLDADYLRTVAAYTKGSINVDEDSPLSTRDLIMLNHAAGTSLLPAPWKGDRVGQRHTLRIEMPTKKGLWLMFGGNTKVTDLNANLAHTLGIRYVRNSLQGDAAEAFARAFSLALCNPGVYQHSDSERTVEQEFFGGEELDMPEYVKRAELYFSTPVFRAITEFQRYEGGRNPAFIASLLNIGLRPAVELSYTLVEVENLSPRVQAHEV